jgi:hypothetical protein
LLDSEIAFIKPHCILAKLKLKLICKEIRIHHKSFSPLLQAREHVSAGIWLKDYEILKDLVSK